MMAGVKIKWALSAGCLVCYLTHLLVCSIQPTTETDKSFHVQSDTEMYTVSVQGKKTLAPKTNFLILVVLFWQKSVEKGSEI